MDTHTYLPASFYDTFTWPVRRQDTKEDMPSDSNQALIIGIVVCISAVFCIPLLWYFIARIIRLNRANARRRNLDETFDDIFTDKSTSALTLTQTAQTAQTVHQPSLILIMCCLFFPRRKRIPDELMIELTEIKPDLERGMLVEIVCIYRDGVEIYSRDKTPFERRLYYHPSFANPLTTSGDKHSDADTSWYG
ncbi:hypothetical protein F53441_10123 [Fusarium austroafricanum]|uniref:Uncharacterized protein n=1 Tax=Fusarium austroafricanum TaxID=2364996 RepID=A0A8H4NUV7_9HYPO|nr:hypothetical protein F53441_10123 [Fusarium austroafricanum]